MDQSKITYDTRHLGVPSDASKLICEHMVSSMQTMQLSCITISTISKQTESSFHLSLFSEEYPIGCVQNGFLVYGALGTNHAPILHQNKHFLQIDQSEISDDMKISTISKPIVRSFHLSLFT